MRPSTLAWMSIAVGLLAAGAGLVFAGTINGLSFWDFTLDDAFITWRYSDHLASGAGPVWNPGEDPVEGYTSPLWMLVSAGGVFLGFDVEDWAKVLSLLAALGLVLMLGLYGRGRHPLARIVAIAGLALSPAFLVIVTQGMETAFAALLATAAAILMLETVRRPDRRRLAAFSVSALLALLARPDLLPYVGVLVAGLAFILLRAPDRGVLRRAAVVFGLAFVLPGAIYLAWRWSYYGAPVPNTFFVKEEGGLVNSLGVTLVKEFVVLVALPYLLVVLLLLGRWLVARRRAGKPLEPELLAGATILAGALAFVAAGVFFYPLQGHLGRFQMPVYPVLLLLLVVLSPASDSVLPGRTRGHQIATLVAALALIIFPLHTFGEAKLQVEARWQYDRVVVARALHELRGLDASMLVTESGALPFYSSWRATDLLGLNDETIAREGLTPEYLEHLAPDLVMLSARLPPAGEPFQVRGYYRQLEELVRDGYRFGAAYLKTDPDLHPTSGLGHLYLVRSGSPHAEEIVQRLRTVSGIEALSATEVGSVLDAFEVEPSVGRRSS